MIMRMALSMLVTIPLFANNSDALHEAALRGDLATVSRLLDEGVDLRFSSGGHTVLEVLERGHEEVGKLLMKRSDSTIFADGLLQYLLENHDPESEIVGIFWERLDEISSRETEQEAASAILAGEAADGNLLAIRALLERGVPVDAGFESPLIAAARSGQADAARLLIEHGADISKEGVAGGNAIMIALLEGFPEVLDVLLEAEADLNAISSEGDTPLGLAARFGGPGMVGRLLAVDGIEIDIRDGEGRTPLMHAAEMGCDRCVALLLDAGADPALEDLSGSTAIELARERQFSNIVSLLTGDKTRLSEALDPAEIVPVGVRESEAVWLDSLMEAWLVRRQFDHVDSRLSKDFFSTTARNISGEAGGGLRSLLEFPFDPEVRCITFCGSLEECLAEEIEVEPLLVDSDATLGFPALRNHVGKSVLVAVASLGDCDMSIMLVATRGDEPELLTIELAPSY
ncbi:MAG: ankyrin repeat domain-containing protein [Acidobacteria bacterium]|nr:ankyrin repeat domain-containing protein [Acidobacteriota bacterium]